MSIVDLSEYIKHREEADDFTRRVHDSILSSCSNPEYVAQCLEEMKLIEGTVDILARPAVHHIKTEK
jgi:hypothetical protein